MTRLAALLCIFAFPVMAQDHVGVTYGPVPDPDDLVIQDSSEGGFAEIVYDNSASMSSSGGDFVLEWNGETFHVHIEIGTREVNHAEIITVVPPDHLLAVPERQEVMDGDVFTIQILAPMF